MQRRELLQRTGAGLTAAMAVGLAGCSDGGGTQTGGGGGGGGAADLPGDISGSVGSTPDGIDIVAVSGQMTTSGGEQTFQIHAKVKNTGDKETDPTEYEWGAELEDPQGSTVDSSGGSWRQTGGAGGKLGPGETTTVVFTPILNDYSGDIGTFTVSMQCTSFWDGSYCS